MARVAVRVVDFEDGALPRVCASTGDEATVLREIRALHHPWWPLLLFFLGPIGWIVALVVASSVSRELSGWVPFSEAANQRMSQSRRTRNQFALGALIGTVVTCLSLALMGRGRVALFVGLIGLLVAAIGWLAAARPAGSIGASLNPNGRTVDLTGVSARFGERYQDQEARRRAERQAGLGSVHR